MHLIILSKNATPFTNILKFAVNRGINFAVLNLNLLALNANIENRVTEMHHKYTSKHTLHTHKHMTVFP